MLAETIAYATSYFATPEPFRRHINEAVGLWSRGRRQAHAWGPHAGETSRSITALIDRLPAHRTVVVLGSGPLFDVPVEALAARFGRVILVDRAHLSPTRQRTRNLANVRHDWRDLSTATTADPLGFLLAIPDLDWVISVNLASQLGVDAPFGQERRVIEAHLADLSRLPCPVTVVTDISFRTVDRAGREHERFDLMHGHPMPDPARTWHWEVAPHGEENRVTRREHVVAFYPDWREASRQKA